MKLSAATLLMSLGIIPWCGQRPRFVTQLPDSIPVLAFQALIDQNGSGVRVKRYCVRYAQLVGDSVRSAEPPPDVARQIRAQGPVQPDSTCRVHQIEMLGRFLDDSGGQVMLLTLQHPLTWSADTLIIDGSYSCGGLCGGGGPIRIWRRGARWAVAFKTEFVS